MVGQKVQILLTDYIVNAYVAVRCVNCIVGPLNKTLITFQFILLYEYDIPERIKC
jgi:hypothetical protein